MLQGILVLLLFTALEMIDVGNVNSAYILRILAIEFIIYKELQPKTVAFFVGVLCPNTVANAEWRELPSLQFRKMISIYVEVRFLVEAILHHQSVTEYP